MEAQYEPIYGVARFVCKSCGLERLVAYSCRGRGLCPSCIAKRSALTAAHLCDSILPVCPYRQWTLSLPFALRYRLIRDSGIFTRVVRTFVRTVFSWQRRQAKAMGLCDVHTGSVTFCQRYGSLLQLNPHAHSWLPDGVFVETDEGGLRFVRLPEPTEEDVEKLCAQIRKRVLRLCATGVDDDSSEIDVDPDDAVIASVQAEAVNAPIRRPHFFEEQPPAPERNQSPLSARRDGFSLHAGLSVKADDRKTLERLLRYGSRPPFAQKRLSVLPSGKVRLKLRKPYYTGQTQLVLEPEAFLRRLFAIIPPPRWHLTRYHGIFSGHHRMRKKLAALLPELPSAPADTGTAGIEMQQDDELPRDDPRRISYAQLLSRVFEQDIGSCQRCGGPLRLIACVDEPDAIGKILMHLGLPTEAPQLAPSRSPPQLEFELGDWDPAP